MTDDNYINILARLGALESLVQTIAAISPNAAVIASSLEDALWPNAAIAQTISSDQRVLLERTDARRRELAAAIRHVSAADGQRGGHEEAT